MTLNPVEQLLTIDVESALQKPDEFRNFAREVEVPLLANMTEFGKSPLLPLHELDDFGYRMVIFPMTAFRVAMKASADFLTDLRKNGTQTEWLDRMQTRKELYDLLDYEGLNAIDRAAVGKAKPR